MMPLCYPNCDLRDLLRAKEDTVNKLQQVMRWCEDLYQSEPHRRQEVIAKKLNVVATGAQNACVRVRVVGTLVCDAPRARRVARRAVHDGRRPTRHARHAIRNV